MNGRGDIEWRKGYRANVETGRMVEVEEATITREVIRPCRHKDIAALIVRDVAELPGRSSPEDQPEMMLVTGAELLAIVEARIEEAR